MKKYFFLIFACIFFLGCSSDPFIEETALETKGPIGGGGIGSPGPQSAFDGFQDGQVVLGRDLSNIYSVEAMRGAYNQKYPNGDGQYGPSGIRTTHYYVRFLPKTLSEYYSICNYDLSEIPLFSEVTKGGSSYHDPSIPADQYTWQYALIPVNKFEQTNVQHEILKNMFIIDYGTPGVPGPGGAPSYTFWEALEIINHKAETGEDIGPGISWTPSGKLEVYDDLLQRYVPLENVRVSVSSDGKDYMTVYTDAEGRFSVNRTFKTSVYYKVSWSPEHRSFEVKDGLIDKAYLVSNRSYLPFNVKLNDSNAKQKNIATVYRAAYRTYFKDYLNMVRPHMYPINQDRPRYIPTRIAYLHKNHDWAAGFYHPNGYSYNPDTYNISIYGLDRSSQSIFQTVTHELAHAGHDLMFPSYKWSASNKIIHESWAVAVEYYITKLEYADYGKDIDNYVKIIPSGPTTYGPIGPGGSGGISYILPNGVNMQWWPHKGNQVYLEERLEYSSLMIDLVDDNNQALYYKLRPAPNTSHKTYPNDDVKGMELSKIQTAICANGGLADFKTQIKALNRRYYSYKNTDIAIDTLFRRYEHYWNQ